MGNKIKKKQARKQATHKKGGNSSAGRNGLSGHNKKAAIGNGKRAAEAPAEGAEKPSGKKNNKNKDNQQSTAMKRKRNESDDESEDEGEDDEKEEGAELQGSSLFNLEDAAEPDNPKKRLSVTSSSSDKKETKKKKKKLTDNTNAIKSIPSVFRPLLAVKLIELEDTSYSRLLYPNPVCFLTTIDHTNTTQPGPDNKIGTIRGRDMVRYKDRGKDRDRDRDRDRARVGIRVIRSLFVF
jgi:hypothetical protein